VVRPVCCRQPRPERVFKAVVEAFHHAVGLGVIGGGLRVLDVQEGAQGGPQGQVELGAAVRCDDGGHSKAAHPSLKQSRGAVKSGSAV
jgi:hypothetical protein